MREQALVSSGQEYLSVEELNQLKKLSNFKASLHVLRCWGVIIAVLLFVTWQPHPLTIFVSLFLLGGSQLSLGGLLHDCSHRAMFSAPRLNDFVGHWLGGIPVLVPLSFYRRYHFMHHTKTGEPSDPDVNNIKSYPVSKASMRRKLMRDFTGQSGLKAFIGVLFYVNTGRAGNAASMGVNKSTMNKQAIWRNSIKNFTHIAIFHLTALSILYALNSVWLYGLWWAAYFFTHPFILRVRQIGEHGAMPALSHSDVRKTTRTTLANWWEKLLFAPNNINFHCEHHLFPTVPAYKLKKLHNLLIRRGFYDDHTEAVEPSYYRVLKKASGLNVLSS